MESRTNHPRSVTNSLESLLEQYEGVVEKLEALREMNHAAFKEYDRLQREAENVLNTIKDSSRLLGYGTTGTTHHVVVTPAKRTWYDPDVIFEEYPKLFHDDAVTHITVDKQILDERARTGEVSLLVLSNAYREEVSTTRVSIKKIAG